MKLDPAFGHWLAGLADGESCFWIHRQRGGAGLAPQFRIKLRADDRAILVACRSTLGIGNLYEHAGERKAHPQVSWAVQSHADVGVLIAVFDRCPLRSKKFRDYKIWRRAWIILDESPRGNRWHGPRDWAPIIALKHELEDVRRYPEEACA